eukprot:scaffold277796_cov53-Attheya_sp.AAC.1
MIPYHVADEDAAVEVLATDGSLDQIEFEISGDPRLLQRPRFARMLRGLGRSYPLTLMYNLSRGIINNFKAAAREVLLVQSGDITVFSNEDYLEVDCWFIIKRPPSHFNIDGSLREDAPCFPLITDVDNMGKLVLDALEGILYPNDKRIVDLRLVKSYPAAGYCPSNSEL